MKKLLALVAKTLGFHPSKDPFTILDEKCELLFYFPIQTCNSQKL